MSIADDEKVPSSLEELLEDAAYLAACETALQTARAELDAATQARAEALRQFSASARAFGVVNDQGWDANMTGLAKLIAKLQRTQ